MWSAKVTLILANIWMYDFYTPNVFETSNQCINTVMTHLSILPEELIENGVGVYKMSCEFAPLPPREKPLWNKN